MDPFLEVQEWDDFHATFNTALRDAIFPYVAPRYVVRVQRRVYLETPGDDRPSYRQPEVSVLWSGEGAGRSAMAGGSATTLEPFECELPMPEERSETYLEIRFQETMEVVTVIETLSPSNKRAGGTGRREYLEKRDAVLQRQANLVELDFLRGGVRLPSVTPLPRADYYAIVSRRWRRPMAAVYAWTIRDRMPPISVPLKKEDGDVSLDLQSVFNTVYELAHYELTVKYDMELQPPVDGGDARWVHEQCSQKSR
jgi:hypothetical protein